MIDKFMNSLATRYTVYFNRKYKRVGSLYQDVYKAVLVVTEEQFLHLSKYIHRNPLKVVRGKIDKALLMDQPSSYQEYLGMRRTFWVHPEEVLAYFSTTNPALSYKSFVNQEDNFDTIAGIRIDLSEDL